LPLSESSIANMNETKPFEHDQLDAKSLYFCSAYFDLPLSQFRCYNKTPFT